MPLSALTRWVRARLAPSPLRTVRPGFWAVGSVAVLIATMQVHAFVGAAPQQPAGPLQPVPSGFLWGVATAGYQWEGGDTHSNWYAWEKAGHVKEPAGLAADGWDRYAQDLDRARSMGLNAFRMSIEWSRIEPEPGRIDPVAVKHYHDVFNAIHARGMTPIVTLLHYTYPAWLDAQAPKGMSAWESPRTVDAYCRYVDFVSREYGADITYYLTFNEPTVMVEGGYLAGCWPPGKQDLGAFLRASRNLIQAHSRAYDIIHHNDPDAMVSFNNYAAAYQFAIDPTKDSVPVPGDDWFLKAFADVLVPREASPNHAGKLKLDYMAVDYYKRLTFPTQMIPPSPSQWHIYPDGFREVLERYYYAFHLPILVAENGFATDNGKPRRDGWTRGQYLVSHIAEVQEAIASGIPVIGYTYWTLTDNYEWGSFNDRFGLYTVDCRHHDYRRVPTAAVALYREIVKEHGATPELVSRYAGPVKQARK